MPPSPESGLLHGIRVLDLATPWAEMAGRLLADLGAEVIKVEPPEGASARRLPPFDGRPGHEGESLYWPSVALGKQSLVVDLDNQAERNAFHALAANADVLIESFPPGRMGELGLGYRALGAANPRLVYVSVSPYGQDGPRAAWPATELTVEASSGRMATQGDGDRPPLPLGYPQSAFHAGAQAACDAIIALNEREISGLGQYLDVSAQAAMTWTLMDATGYPPLTGADPPGGGDDRGIVPARAGSTVATPCRDGYVVVAILPQRYGSVLPGILAELSMDRHPAVLVQEDWSTWEERTLAGSASLETAAAAQEAILAFYRRHTKAELHAWATANDIRLAPINHAGDVLAAPHFASHGFWREVGGRRHAGSPARLSRADFGPTRSAPELDSARSWLPELLRPRSLPPSPAGGDRLGEPFAGLKVADFTWVAAGPLTAKAFADHGATVVKIESGARLDLVRALPPFLGNVPGPNRSQWMGNVNSSKRGIALNLGTPEGVAIARRIAFEWADVVMDSYTPGTMERFGLDHATLLRERPDIIAFSTCLMGHTGPLAAFGGYGQHGAAIAGMTHLTGWPDRPPAGPSGPYSDIVTPRFAVSILAAAVLDRRRTGRGISIDLSQAECALRFLEPLLLDAAVNGRIAGPSGHWNATACPSGVYPATGTQRYVVVSVETSSQWEALCSLVDLGRYRDPAFAAVSARRPESGALDARITAWTRTRDAFEAEAELCAVGVPAAAVQRASDLHRDPQLAHRGFFVPLDHPEMGRVPYDGFAARFSAKRVDLHRPAPLLGEHTEEVLRELLGMDADAIAEAAAAGALS